MKAMFNWSHSLIVALLLLSTFSYCQIDNPSQKAEIEFAAKEIISGASTCALITLDSEGAPRARAMDPFPLEEDFTVWFGTNSNSRKVTQIKNDPRVTLYYLSKDATGYVIISGKAVLVDDQKTKDHYWKEKWKDFYPESRDNYLLIKVIPHWMEVLSPTHNIYNDSITWQPPVLRFEHVD